MFQFNRLYFIYIFLSLIFLSFIIKDDFLTLVEEEDDNQFENVSVKITLISIGMSSITIMLYFSQPHKYIHNIVINWIYRKDKEKNERIKEISRADYFKNSIEPFYGSFFLILILSFLLIFDFFSLKELLSVFLVNDGLLVVKIFLNILLILLVFDFLSFYEEMKKRINWCQYYNFYQKQKFISAFSDKNFTHEYSNSFTNPSKWIQKMEDAIGKRWSKVSDLYTERKSQAFQFMNELSETIDFGFKSYHFSIMGIPALTNTNTFKELEKELNKNSKDMAAIKCIFNEIKLENKSDNKQKRLYERLYSSKFVISLCLSLIIFVIWRNLPPILASFI